MMGISQVTLNTISQTSAINDGYQDYSCLSGGAGATTLLVGASHTLTVRTNPAAAENVRVWIDFDNNGIFNPITELFFSSTATGLHTGTNLPIPASAVLNTPLRMRVADDWTPAPVPTPCSTPRYGQFEDYTVTLQANTAPPVAAFTAGNNVVTCSGLVQFTDQSSGAPTTWRWRFGDGSAPSLQQNPQHQYTTAGVYSVTLTVTNANGTDSLTRTNYIQYDPVVPVAASCTPQTAAYCCGYGISRVRFADLDRASGDGAAGFEDFTCGARATVVGGNRYKLTVNKSTTQAQDVRAWLDFNNDGQFTAAEQVLVALSQDTAVATITIPLTAPINTALRLRIAADAAGQPMGPCVAPQLGQMEDYSVVVRANTLPPITAFTVTPVAPCDTVKTFTDHSQNAPTGWLWNFGDGATSTLQNPQHTYQTSGTYTITLITTNAFGTDTLVRANAAFVLIPCRTYCTPTGLQTQSIWIERVQFAAIDRVSGLDPNAYTVTYDPPAQLTQGQPQMLTVTTNILPGMGGPPNFITAAWIDFNQNGTWEASERVLQQQGNPASPTVQQLVGIPGNALIGVTMMRVLTTRNGQFANNPCPPNNAPGLEIEDYLVVVSAQQAPPVAGFSVDNQVSCDGLVQFTDTSSNVPSTWRWDFGDGIGTSTVANPQYQYPTTMGTYTVKLVVTNAFGQDSVTRLSYVTVRGIAGPIAPSCRPESATPGFGIGIDSVHLQAYNRVMTNSTPNPSDSYRDYSCDKRGVVFAGLPATLRVRTIQAMGARVVAWIDYNNDGVFDAIGERVLIGNNQPQGVYQATFTVPAGTVRNVALRLRVGSDWTNNPTLRPCGNAAPRLPQYGQFEDYTVTVRDTVLAVAAARPALALTVLPNPTLDGRLAVRLTGDVPGTASGAPLTLTVRTVLGQVVERRTLTVRPGADAVVDLSTLPTGVYIVQTDGPVAALRGTIRLIRE